MSKFLKISALLTALIFIWGVGWPVITLGLPFCPPIWYSALRLMIGTVFMFVIMGLSGRLIMPQKKDLPLLFSIGIVQIGVFIMLITLGLEYVPPGRSSIIAYISPFFVAPIAVMFFGEKLSWGKISGLALGAIGIGLLFSPWELNWHDRHVMRGNGLLVVSAIAWSFAMLHTRYAKWDKPPHLLLPWQLLAGTFLNVIAALIISPHPQIILSKTFLFSISYSGILSSGAAYWLMIVLTRSLSVVTASLCLLIVPIVGLISSAMLTGESLSLTTFISFGLILSGLICIFVKP